MNSSFSNITKNILFNNIVLLVVGIILTIWPDESLNVAVNLVGSVILLFGAITLVMNFVNKNSSSVSLFIGILATIIGLFVIVRSATVISIMHILLGIAILADGLSNLKKLMDFKSDDKMWKVLLISAIITSLLGIVLIFKPFFIASMITRLGGIFIVISSLQGLMITYKIKKIKVD